jgi:hypothetical protein
MISFLLKDEKATTTFFFRLEQKYGLFFHLKYFEENILDGDWEKCEKYLCDCTKRFW